jgi:cobalt-zinc-cadmium efflux system membrane fusion protein
MTIVSKLPTAPAANGVPVSPAPPDPKGLMNKPPTLPAAAGSGKAPPGFRLPKVAVAILGVVGLAILVAVLAGSGVVQPMLDRLREHPADKEPAKEEPNRSHELVRDAQGRLMLKLSEEAARSLDISAETIVPARPATEPRPLPALDGQLAYESDGLYPIRPRFAGEVEDLGQVDPEGLEEDGNGSSKQVSGRWQETRPVGFGDTVKGPYFDAKGRRHPGQLLAVIWSKDLGDKKAALIDALIDLRRDTQRLQELKAAWEKNAIPYSTYYEAQRTVQKDTNAANAAERTLRIWRLDDEDIAAIKKEAAAIQEAKRDPKKERDWARVEVRAPHDGIIVEKNTNLRDWVDPTNSPPMFKVADLRRLAVWANAPEKLRPILQKLLAEGGLKRLRWQIRLIAEPKAPPLEGPVLRIAPSVDPNNRNMLVIGRVDNPGGRLIVGQLITATIFVQPEPDLVTVPTTALNEQDGQSLVFIQPDPKKLEFQLRRVAVAERFKDVVLVRSKLTPADERESAQAAGRGLQKLEPLSPQGAQGHFDRVVTQGVPMLTEALRDLVAREGGK